MDGVYFDGTRVRISGEMMGYWSGVYNGVKWDIEFKNGKFYAEIYFTPSRITQWGSKSQAAQWIVKTINERGTR